MVDEKDNLLFTSDVGKELTSALAKTSWTSLFVLVDENTAQNCLPIIKDSLPDNYQVINIPSGEENKTLVTCELIWQQLTEAQADRQALLINLGGGVICDMGGFCARTYKRGILFWNIPTTLLAQVDASVGGKLGVDFGDFKNQIGLFSDPDLVILDSVFFATLPQDERISGFAEMVKHALISSQAMFNELRQLQIETVDWNLWIPKSVAIKSDIVARDPFEKGLRKVLNFGHTIGHAIESYFLNTDRPLKHGEAVAMGMITETYLSINKDLLPENEGRQIIDYLLKIFPTQEIEVAAIDQIVKLALQDKKNTNGKINAVLLTAIGKAAYDVEISEDEIRRSLNYYNKMIK